MQSKYMEPISKCSFMLPNSARKWINLDSLIYSWVIEGLHRAQFNKILIVIAVQQRSQYNSRSLDKLYIVLVLNCLCAQVN